MKKKLLIALLIIALVVGVSSALAITASAETAAPDMSIAYCNLSFRDSVCIKYAVKSNAPDVKILIWTAPETEYVVGTQDDEITEYYSEKISGVSHMVFDYTKLTAKQMGDVVYARAYARVDGVDYYSEVNKYSILQYAHNKLASATTGAELKEMLTNMLSYGASAQKYFDYKEDRLATADWYQVKVTAGALSDGSQQGLYLPGDKVTLIAPETDVNGKVFSRWLDSNGNQVATTATFELTGGTTNEVYTPVYGHTVVIDEAVAPTCTKTGLTEGSHCSVCGEVFLPQTVIDALGHSYNATITVPTCTEQGYTTYTCHCGDCYVDNYEDVLGHNYDDIGKCSRCGSYEAFENAEYITTNDGWVIALSGNDAFLMTYCGDGKKMLFPSTYMGINLNFDYFDFDYKTVKETLEILWICDEFECEIEPYQFHSFVALQYAILGNGVTSIGTEAFGLCKNLISVTIGEGVKRIGIFPFDQCFNLEYIIYNATRVETIEGSSIAPFEFCGRDSGGIELTIGDHVELLPRELFSSWDVMPSSAPYIKTVNISADGNLQEIEIACFQDCAYIYEMVLPKALRRICANAFDNCALNTIYFGGTSLEWEEVIIEGGNESIHRSTVYFYSSSAPTDNGNYWRYIDGEPTPWS